MKKIIIIAVVILSAALAFSLSRASEKKENNIVKVEKADFAVKSINTPNPGLATAD